MLEAVGEVYPEAKYGKATRDAAQREQAVIEEKESMLKTIGQLTLERDCLMKQAHERNKGVFLRRG